MKAKRWGFSAALCVTAVFFIHGSSLALDDLKIQSESMVIDESSGNIKFSGNVMLKKDSITINSDDMTLFSSESEPDSIARVVALGNVVLKKEDDSIYSERAEFDFENSRIILTGKTRFERGTESISASRIVYNLDTGIASFTGSVDAVISPRAE
ncbi:MAG: LptA/OstA family protein [bacterium]